MCTDKNFLIIIAKSTEHRDGAAAALEQAVPNTEIQSFGDNPDDLSDVLDIVGVEKNIGIVMVVDEHTNFNDELRCILEMSCNSAKRENGFRVFFLFKNTTKQAFFKKTMSPENETLVGMIKDTIQCTGMDSLPKLAKSVGEYVRHRDTHIKTRSWHKLKNAFSNIASMLYLALLFLCACSLVLSSVISLPTVISSLAVGIAFAYCLPFLLFQFTQKRALKKQIDPLAKYTAQGMTLAFFGILFLVSTEYKYSIHYIALGVCIGGLLDMLNRQWQRRFSKHLVFEKSGHIKSVEQGLKELFVTRHFNLTSYPLLPPASTIVFTSYPDKTSDVSKKIITKLNQALKRNGVRNFFDKECIQEGSRWKSELDKAISMANIFIAYINEDTLTSKWCQYELETALRIQYTTGTLKVLLLFEDPKNEGYQKRVDSILTHPELSPIHHIAIASASKGQALDPALVPISLENAIDLASRLKFATFTESGAQCMVSKKLSYNLCRRLKKFNKAQRDVSFPLVFLGLVLLYQDKLGFQIPHYISSIASTLLLLNLAYITGMMIRYMVSSPEEAPSKFSFRYTFGVFGVVPAFFTIALFDFVTPNIIIWMFIVGTIGIQFAGRELVSELNVLLAPRRQRPFSSDY